MRVAAAPLLLLVLVAPAAVLVAHHGSADYHVDREVSVSGVVTEWRWSNPHTWLSLTATRPDGTAEAWDGEGPPLSWAVARNWSKETLRPGEQVTVVMYPSRDNPRSGLVKRVHRAGGDVLQVSRPWLDR